MDVAHATYSKESIGGCKVSCFKSSWLGSEVLMCRRKFKWWELHQLLRLWIFCLKDNNGRVALSCLGLLKTDERKVAVIPIEYPTYHGIFWFVPLLLLTVLRQYVDG